MADAAAVRITGNPQAMASALRKISEHCNLDAPAAVRAMCIAPQASVFSPAGQNRQTSPDPAHQQPAPAMNAAPVAPAAAAPPRFNTAGHAGRKSFGLRGT